MEWTAAALGVEEARVPLTSLPRTAKNHRRLVEHPSMGLRQVSRDFQIAVDLLVSTALVTDEDCVPPNAESCTVFLTRTRGTRNIAQSANLRNVRVHLASVSQFEFDLPTKLRVCFRTRELSMHFALDKVLT